MVKQTPVFLNMYIHPDKVGELDALLNGNPNDPAPGKQNPWKPGGFFPFDKLKTVHFGRWLIAPATDEFRASVIYSSNIDGELEDHLKDLSEQATDELHKIFSLCEGYLSQGNPNSATLLAYMRKNSKSTPGFYVGAPNRTVDQVHKEAKLHDTVRDYVRDNGKEWKSSRESYDAIKKFLADDPQWAWAREKYQLPKKRGFKMILLILLILVLLPVLLLAVLWIHFVSEARSKPFGKTVNQIDQEHLTKMKDQEDIIYQNQISQVFETKTGLRRLWLKFILWATNYAAKNWFIEGTLMGTPTIHFARWVMIDDGKRFVFFSNFDGSFDEYLGDFVDNGGWGLNAIYGAAKGYPKTKFIFGGGAYKVLEFMGWGRITQVQTQQFYSAYPWYGLQQIISKTELRSELFNQGELNDEEIKDMLRRI
jgi:hypothetical protein